MLPARVLLDTREALSDWRISGQEAQRVVTMVFEEVVGAVIIAMSIIVFDKAVSESKKHNW